jgi:hypothetical protein
MYNSVDEELGEGFTPEKYEGKSSACRRRGDRRRLRPPISARVAPRRAIAILSRSLGPGGACFQRLSFSAGRGRGRGDVEFASDGAESYGENADSGVMCVA